MENRSAEIARAIAEHLAGWEHLTPADAGHYAVLRRMDPADGAELTLSVSGAYGSKPARLWVRGSFPRDPRSGDSYGPTSSYHPADLREGTEGIGLSPTKTGQQLARDIARRLLPAYLKAYAWALDRKAQADATNGEAEAMAAKLAGVLGTVARPSHNSSGPISVDPRGLADGSYGGFEVSRHGTVTLKLSGLEPRLVLALAETIARFSSVAK